jgi:hypothetical protein
LAAASQVGGPRISPRLVSEVRAATVRMNFRIKLDAWDGVGPVDVAMCGEDSQPIAFFELKCGSRTLFNGVWDVAKMARAVQLRADAASFSRGYSP